MSAIIIEKPRISIDQDLLHKLKQDVDEQGNVILHFLFENGNEETLIRIWQSSFLFDCHSDHHSKLMHVENITLFPHWTACSANKKHFFTLIFEGLPKSCKHFDFIEYCGGAPGAFMVEKIPRNKSDVYYLKLTS